MVVEVEAESNSGEVIAQESEKKEVSPELL